MRRRIRGLMGVIGLASMCASCANRATMAISVPAAPPTTARTQSKPVPCTLRIGQILDDRMDPTVLGQVGGRTVRSPADTQVWLRAVISRLAGQGIVVEFAGERDAQSTAIYADAKLKSVWVDSAATAKLASVVLNMQYSYRGTSIKTADYRGSVSTVNWNNTNNEVQGMVDDALAQVLMQLANDFRTLCVKATDTPA
jgi:hypothetical protein